jgi:alpha-glucosidase
MLYGANPKTILENPCAPMIKSMPTTWDETKVLSFSEIGDVAAFARRKGDTWFLGIANGPTARTVKVPLTFLGQEGYQSLLIYDDKNNPAAVRIEEGKGRMLRAVDSLTIEMSAGGGFVGRFVKG